MVRKTKPPAMLPAGCMSPEEASMVTNECGIVLRLGWLTTELLGIQNAITMRKTVLDFFGGSDEQAEEAMNALNILTLMNKALGQKEYDKANLYQSDIMEAIHDAHEKMKDEPDSIIQTLVQMLKQRDERKN